MGKLLGNVDLERNAVDSEYGSDAYGGLFMAMAEELKLPLMHIARLAELESMRAPVTHTTKLSSLMDIQSTADMSLQLLDSYLLSLRLSLQPEARLELEPVSVSAVLHDTVGSLRHVADQYGVELHLHVEGRYEPVMAHRQALQSAMVSLGHALIAALPSAGVSDMKSRKLQLATHRTKQGIVAGVYGELEGLTPRMFRRAQDLQGHVRQPMVAVLPGSGAGLFMADTLLGAMASRLRVGRFQKLPGFAVTLTASEQLQLI